MSTIFDYIKWRGDLSFSADPFNEIDNMIFTQFCFLDFAGIMPPSGESIQLSDAVNQYYKGKTDEDTKLGTLVPDTINKLAKEIALTERFGSLRLCKYSDVIVDNGETDLQFAALAVMLPGDRIVISFRGTDDTIVGWKEDANLALFPNIPAQRLALEFVESTANEFEGRIIICGHSKGGNLSIYSAKNSCDSTKERIERVFNNDGPGFSEDFFTDEEYLKIKSKVTTIIPQGSVVGTIFEQDNDSLKIVHSTNIGALQHDIFSWQLEGKCLTSDTLSRDAIAYKKSFNAWISEMSIEERRLLIDSLFKFLSSSGAKTLTEAVGDKKPQLNKIYKESSRSERLMLLGIVRSFIVKRASNGLEVAADAIKSKLARESRSTDASQSDEVQKKTTDSADSADSADTN